MNVMPRGHQTWHQLPSNCSRCSCHKHSHHQLLIENHLHPVRQDSRPGCDTSEHSGARERCRSAFARSATPAGRTTTDTARAVLQGIYIRSATRLAGSRLGVARSSRASGSAKSCPRGSIRVAGVWAADAACDGACGEDGGAARGACAGEEEAAAGGSVGRDRQEQPAVPGEPASALPGRWRGLRPRLR